MCDTRHIHSYLAWDRKCICFFWIVGVYYSNFSLPPCIIYSFCLLSSAERKEDQVCSIGEYQRVFTRLNSLPSDVEHVIVQIGADTFSFFFLLQ
jgi:hypothetical protein